MLPKAESLRMETLSYHLPGPIGVGSEIEASKKTASWSEKDQGKISHEDKAEAKQTDNRLNQFRTKRAIRF